VVIIQATFQLRPHAALEARPLALQPPHGGSSRPLPCPGRQEGCVISAISAACTPVYGLSCQPQSSAFLPRWPKRLPGSKFTFAVFKLSYGAVQAILQEEDDQHCDNTAGSNVPIQSKWCVLTCVNACEHLQRVTLPTQPLHALPCVALLCC
jgi:hypothetical protein